MALRYLFQDAQVRNMHLEVKTTRLKGVLMCRFRRDGVTVDMALGTEDVPHMKPHDSRVFVERAESAIEAHIEAQ